MTLYRRFRNTDPPELVDVWNAALPNRGAYPLRTAGLLDRWVLSKTYFDPDALTVAVDPDGGKAVGFSLAGFGPNHDLSAANTDDGVVCFVAVKPEWRRKGIGRELVRRAEEYLTTRGATTLRAGPVWPHNPYGFGMYGGGNSPGWLSSDPDADPFITSLGYAPVAQVQVFQKRLEQPLTLADPRFVMLRKRYDLQLLRAAAIGSWWHDCVWGPLEPVEFRLVDKLTNIPAARAVVWEMEGYGWRWNHPSAGVFDAQVRPDLRRQGLGKMLIAQILRFLQDQFFGVVELQTPTDNEPAVQLCKSLGMSPVDLGTTYVKA